MNTPITYSRRCAQHCCRATARSQPTLTLQQQSQLQFRSFSTTKRQSITSSEINPPPPTVQPSPSEHQPFSNLQPELSNLSPSAKENTSHHPEDQDRPAPSQLFTGTVTRTGTMPQTVQVTRQHQVFDTFLQKHYTRPLRIKVHDPNPPSYLREGDIIEYGLYTQLEKDAKAAKNEERIAREEARIAKNDKTGRLVKGFRRKEAVKTLLKGKKVRGVQFVVRRVVTPFGVGLDERMEKLSVGGPLEGQESSAQGGQDSLLKSLGGGISRRSGRASVAG